MGYPNEVSKVLMLHLLGRCNLECLHCYMEGAPRRQEQLPVEDVLRAISECPELNVKTLILTGGEPLLYSSLSRVLEAAAATPELKTTVCTNGTLITQRHAAEFHERDVRVNISIDGEPEFHDRFRKLPGAFRSSERGVHLAVDAGVPVTIISTISKANLHALEFLVEWAAAAGAEQFLAQPLLNLGRGTRIMDQCLTFDDVNRLILQLTDLANRPRTRKLKCQVIGAKRQFLMQHPCGAYVCNGASCHRGVEKEIKKIVVREEGTVVPEVPNLSHRYALGKIQDNSLSKLISDYYAKGYSAFDRLCRMAYSDTLPRWNCVIVPWEQIIAERSHSTLPAETLVQPIVKCSHCGPQTYGNLQFCQ